MDLIDFLPLRVENIESIRARVDSDVNSGYAPDDDAFIDTVIGGFYYDLTQAVLLEVERVWDFLATEVPAVAFITSAWGEYLDEHGEVLGVPRKDASGATGEVTFTGEDGTIIPQGTVVATTQTSPDVDPVEYTTDAAATVSGTTVTVGATASEVGSRGNAASGTVTVILTPLADVTAVINASAMSGGADVENDELYRARLLAASNADQGPGTQRDYERWAVAFPGIGFAAVTPLWAGAGTVRVVVTDTDNNPVSQSLADDLQDYLDPASASTLLNGSVTLPSGTITVDDTTGFSPVGHFYIARQRVRYTGMTGTTFTGCTGGSGLQADNSPVIQRGTGLGAGTIGHEVTVDTPTTLTVDVAANVDLEAGYSLDGSAGTTGIETDIVAAIQEYIDNLKPGADVLLNRVEAAIISVQGVYNVSGSPPVTLEGSAADVAVGITEVPLTGTVSLTAV